MRWWSSRGLHADKKRKGEVGLLLGCEGQRVIHVFDRGFAGSPGLRLCFALRQRLVVRWPHRRYLIDEQGRGRKAGQIAEGKRPWIEAASGMLI